MVKNTPTLKELKKQALTELTDWTENQLFYSGNEYFFDSEPNETYANVYINPAVVVRFVITQTTDHLDDWNSPLVDLCDQAVVNWQEDHDMEMSIGVDSPNHTQDCSWDYSDMSEVENWTEAIAKTALKVIKQLS